MLEPVESRTQQSIPPGQRIAIVGAGVAGITSAELLQTRHKITLFEKNKRLGGHTNTILIDSGPDEGTAVDTGFIVTNRINYPLFQQLLKHWGVPLRDSDMSFSYRSEQTEYEYGTSQLAGLIARRRNLIEPRFWQMMRGMFALNRSATKDVREENITNESLGDYLARKQFPQSVVDHFLIPMGAAIWSTSPAEMLEYPAKAFFQFWDNHHLLQVLNRPIWQTVVGGSHQYLKAFQNSYRGDIRVDASISRILRSDTGAQIEFNDGHTETYDHVVIATHADQALKLLGDPTPREQSLLGAWEYSRNATYLHTDESFMPKHHACWSSWNFLAGFNQQDNAAVTVTYDMNRLQGLETQHNYFVTLNPHRPIQEDQICYETIYTHPLMTEASLQTQPQLHELNGQHRTYFCGSYFGSGFHEDAVRSGVHMAKLFGLEMEHLGSHHLVESPSDCMAGSME